MSVHRRLDVHRRLAETLRTALHFLTGAELDRES